MGCICGADREDKDAKKRQQHPHCAMVSPSSDDLNKQVILDLSRLEGNKPPPDGSDRTAPVPKSKRKVRQVVKVVRKQDQEGHKVINDYVMLDFLGQGSFGKVKLAEKQGNQYALKILKKSFLRRKKDYYKDSNGQLKVKDALSDVKREIAVMKKLAHPNLITLHEVIDNPDSDKIIMVLDYANQGQLIEWDEDENRFYFLQTEHEQLTEDQLRVIFRDCIKGLYYLHEHGIVHRDIKPQNILFNDNHALIADFGVSLIVGHSDLLENTQGTYHFMPPEACDKDRVKQGYSGKAADVWALGVTFFCFTFLMVPFSGNTIQEIMEVISQSNLVFPDERPISSGLKDFLQFMIQKDLDLRPTLQQAAQHPWLNEASTPLMEEIGNEKVNLLVSEEEIQNAYSISTFIRIKNWANKWRSQSQSNKLIRLQHQSNTAELPKK